MRKIWSHTTPMEAVVRAAVAARRHRSEGRRARRLLQLNPRKRRKSPKMRMERKRRRKANDLPTHTTLLFILNNLLGLNLLQSKMGLTFQSLYDISQFFYNFYRVEFINFWLLFLMHYNNNNFGLHMKFVNVQCVVYLLLVL